jgi:hypothetical protein
MIHAIQRMRNNRAPAEDTIVAVLMKYGGVMDAVHELTKLIRTTESLSLERKTGII